MGTAQGFFIAFEGGEGAGKSTQESRLAGALAEAGHAVVRTREPGGTPAAEAIRHVVLSPEFAGLDPRAEALLFAAARGEHVARIVRPALARGIVVVCDRYLDSSVAYQGYGRDLGAEHVRDLNLWATRGLLPDLTVVLDVDPQVGLARVDDPDRLEAEPLAYHQAVRAAFVDIAAQDPGRYLVIDANGHVDAIASAILDRVTTDLARR
ncbi:MAG: dTMP kinase [Candidatus Nanopelagicales bacterium]